MKRLGRGIRFILKGSYGANVLVGSSESCDFVSPGAIKLDSIFFSTSQVASTAVYIVTV